MNYYAVCCKDNAIKNTEKEFVMDGMKLEYFTDNEDFPFFIQYGEHNKDMPLHGHDDFTELVIVLKGKAVHIVEEERFEIKKGDVFVLNGKKRHGYEDTENFELCNIMFRSGNIFFEDYDIKKSPEFHALFFMEPYLSSTQGFGNRLTLLPDDFNFIKNLIEKMVNEYKNDTIGRKTVLVSYFMVLAVTLSRLYGIRKNKKKDLINISNAAAYIESNYMEKISLPALAKISHYSLRHFIRLFTEIYKTTPQKYVINIRIRQASKLLRDSNLNISEVGYRCGFNNINFFSRTFKKHVGMTPTMYRENITK